jgi:transglutaminase-like putative cysteine protease
VLYLITHTTTYEYSENVSVCQNEARLTPRERKRQTNLRHDIQIDPEPAHIRHRVDFFGNPVVYFCIQQPHEQLRVTALSEVQINPVDVPDPKSSQPWEQARQAILSDRTPLGLMAYQFAFDSPYVKSGPDLAAFADVSFQPGRPLLECVTELNHRIYDEFEYDPKATNVSTPVREVLENKRGVCQDFAHLMLCALRSKGLAARYVSGYLRTIPPEGKPRLQGADASHAWVSVYVPDTGWVDFDPTNDTNPKDQHVTLAWGRDFGDVSPIKGVILGGGHHAIKVAVDVVPI